MWIHSFVTITSKSKVVVLVMVLYMGKIDLFANYLIRIQYNCVYI